MSTDLTQAPSGGQPENNALATLRPPELKAATRPSPRVWPFAVLVGLFWAWSFFFQWAEVETGVRFLARVGISALLVLVFTILWWANWRISLVEKILVFFIAVAGGIATAFLTLKTFGPIALLLTALPFVVTTWAVWLQLSPIVGTRIRQIGLFVVILLTWGAFTLLRMNGINGEQEAALHWRWTPTSEQLYLAQRAQRSAEAAEHPAPRTTVSLRPGDWPGFRGPERDGAVHGIKIATDWNAAPPRLLWKQLIGPGWSSVAVVGGRLYTQEQRDQVEAVVCLDAATGHEIWSREDPARFEESVAGAGPRGTPAFADGRIYTLGATGVLSCRDAAGGDLNWSRNLVAEAGAKAPIWGFCSSPLVVNGVVVAYAEGGPKNLLAYHADSGEPAWAAAAGKASYSSPQPATLHGQSQILFSQRRRPVRRRSHLGEGAVGTRRPGPGGAADPPAARRRRFASVDFLRSGPWYGPDRRDSRRRWLDDHAALGDEERQVVLQRLRGPRRVDLRLRRRRLLLRGSENRRAALEARSLRPRPGDPARRPGLAPGHVGKRQGDPARRQPRQVRGTRALPGRRGQDLEPSGDRQRPAIRP
jgi:hypothetical protein